ncbi:MAG: heme iron utilization protein [Sulfuricurvum sp. PC08-66]|nr:MAG: heme iron utilization protein [Sulfuricurvum sp. PC08-66]
MKTIAPFIAPFRSVLLSTLDSEGNPFGSYAPFVYEGATFYCYLSDIATHAQNLQRHPKAGLLFIEDESQTSEIFARKRLSLQCDVEIVAREDARFETIMGVFGTRFDASTVARLVSMQDFRLYAFRIYRGEATFGFGEAYTVGGEDMQMLVPRMGGGHRPK